MTDPQTSEAADVELVRRAKAADLEAFETLTNRPERQIYSLALRRRWTETHLTSGKTGAS
jgi:hypothetical protein